MNFCCIKKFLTFRPLTFKARESTDVKNHEVIIKCLAYYKKKVMTKLSDLLGHTDERLTYISQRKYTHVFILHYANLFEFGPEIISV